MWAHIYLRVNLQQSAGQIRALYCCEDEGILFDSLKKEWSHKSGNILRIFDFFPKPFKTSLALGFFSKMAVGSWCQPSFQTYFHGLRRKISFSQPDKLDCIVKDLWTPS